MTRATAKQDSRLVRSTAAQAPRDTRSTADAARDTNTGNALSDAERRKQLREAAVDETLPTPPPKPGWTRCWLSTTHSSDTIYNRVRKGWQPVMARDIPGYDTSFASNAGDRYDGIVRCNEMLLYEIPTETHNDLMVIHHHDMPNEEEAGIRQKLRQATQQTSDGEDLGIAEEGGFKELGKHKTPIFHC